MPEESRGEGLDESLYDEYIADNAKIPSLEGKVVAITGTTTGLGFHLARTALTKGVKVLLLLNRESERSKSNQVELNDKYNKEQKTKIQFIACDLMNLESVRQASTQVNDVASQHGGLDVLCCNAGVMMMSDTRTKDGFDVQMQTNQLSHALLMHLTWKSLQQAETSRGEARVVFQSSSARSMPSTNLEAKYYAKCEPMSLGGDSSWFITQALGWRDGPIARYHHSKLANSAFGMALHHKLQAKSSKIKSLVCEPGYSVTPLQTTSHFLPNWMLWFPMPQQSAADGSLNAAMACFSLEAESGDFYVPASGLVGAPKKVISKGEATEKGGEKLTCLEANQTTVWDGCQTALGIEFAV